MSINPNPAANYVPPMKGYSGQGAFRFWCQTVLPLVYDDSLSYYELLNKVVNYLNNTISDVANVEDNVDALHTAYAQLEGYVNDYFSSLDVQEEIDKKLDVMAVDGSLSSLIDPFVAPAVDEWLGEHLTPTSPALDDTFSLGNAAAKSSQVGEIIAGYYDSEHNYKSGDYCVYEGMIYKCKVDNTTGTWDDEKWDEFNVCDRIKNSENDITNFKSTLNVPRLSWALNKSISSSGAVNASNWYALSDIIRCSGGDRFINMTPAKDSGNNSFVMYYATYTTTNTLNDTFVERVGYMSTRNITVGENITGIRFSIGRSSTTGVQISVADLDYVSIEYYMKNASIEALSNLEIYSQKNREDIYNIKSSLNVPSVEWLLKKYVDTSGNIGDSNYYAMSRIMPCSGGDTFVNKTVGADSNNVAFVMYYMTYTTTNTPNDTFVERVGFMSERYATVDENITGIRFLFGRDASTGVQISESDLDYVDIEYYMKGAPVSTLLNIYELNMEETPDMFCYTTFEQIPHYWKSDGNFDASAYYHSQNCRIIQGGRFYMSGMPNQEVIGAYFNERGEWIAPLNKSSGTQLNYQKPDGTNTYVNYADIYYFTAPVGAYYVSLNIPAGNTTKYRVYISSKPVFLLTGSGNFCVKNDPTYAAYSKKKVCVIGASKTMIDRLRRPASGSDHGYGYQYLVGWQEYLAPWFDTLQTYGYSGHPMGTGAKYGDSPPSGYQTGDTVPSIYQHVVLDNGGLDLSGYDIFIISSTHNGLVATSTPSISTGTGVGDWGTFDTVPNEHDTYMGALRNLVEYIYTQNPLAEIYISTLEQADVYIYNATFRTAINELNTKIREMCNGLGLKCNDWAYESGFNKNTFYYPEAPGSRPGDTDPWKYLTYDGTHFNQNGGRVIGLLTRKNVLGF